VLWSSSSVVVIFPCSTDVSNSVISSEKLIAFTYLLKFAYMAIQLS
jgi:hypothetical protein